MKIFISYRRDDSAGYAGRLFDHLTARFGAKNVFMDIDTIEPGEDFRKVVENAVGTCDVVLVLMGKQWLSTSDAQGRRRLDNPRDWVRVEIASALANPQVRVIPVLVRDATMPGDHELPDELKELSWRNAIELSDTRFQHDANKLIGVIERLPGKPMKTPAGAQHKRGTARFWGIVLGVATLGSIIGMVRYGIIAAGVFSPATPIITASFTNLAPSTSTPNLPPPTEVVLVTDTLSVIPTEFPVPSPIGVYFGEWIITIGKFPSIESAKSYIVPFVDNGYSVQIFCRISEADPSQTPEIRAAVIGFDSENSMNEALPRVQVLNQYAQSKQFPLWCLNPVQQVDYVSCNFVSCQ